MNPKAQVAKAKTRKWDFSAETASALHSEEGKETLYGPGDGWDRMSVFRKLRGP